ncbi:DUF6508 domain-containing protein [Ascidiimonas sp. W6]|uniref:DUF6508 domain-containing protein n=1 Tax=Ascidiimonas meishanensis TaxID=3128903 RepID=UPI0030EC789B
MKEINSQTITQVINSYNELSEEAKAGREPEEYPSPHPDLHPFLGMLEHSGFTEVFDWGTWIESIGVDNLNSTDYLEKANLETLRKLMSAHLRMERFYAGHIQKLFTSNYMNKFFQRLETFQNYK